MQPHAARYLFFLFVALSYLVPNCESSGQDPLPAFGTRPLPLPATQRTVVDAVRAIGGTVRQDEAGHVVFIAPLLTDKGLQPLKSLKGLQTLSAIETDFTVEGLKDLRKARPAIRFVPEVATEAEEPALAYFRDVRGERPFQKFDLLMTPRIMYLDNTNISDTDLEQIHKLPRLEVLHVDGEHLSDSSLAEIAKLAGLRELHVHTPLNANNPFTDDGLKQLVALTQLETLYLGWQPDVTDAGMIHLRKLPKLKSLNISGSQITIEGVRQLRFCEHLKSFTAYETNINYYAVCEELPGVEITLFD